MQIILEKSLSWYKVTSKNKKKLQILPKLAQNAFFLFSGCYLCIEYSQDWIFFRDICSVILNRILLVCDANCCEILRICEILSNFAVD